MDLKFLSLVLVICGIQFPNRATSNGCLDLAYCNLLKGDIAGVSEKLGKDGSKYYTMAEENMASYKTYIKTKDETVAQGCNTSHVTCSNEVTDMAVNGLNFPATYKDSCGYESYSRTIFECKNFKNWPAKVKERMPAESKTCDVGCLITETEPPMTLTTGRVVNADQGLPPIDQTLQEEIESEMTETRQIGLSRPYVKVLSGFNDNSNGAAAGWSQLDVCPLKQWVSITTTLAGESDKAHKEHPVDHEYHLQFGCWKNGDTRFNQMTLIGDNNANAIPQIYRHVLYSTCWTSAVFGAGQPPNAFLVGISFHLVQYKTAPTKNVFHVNLLCAGPSLKWKYYGPASQSSQALICPNTTAICSLQIKRAEFEGKKYITNLRVGCCAGEGNLLSFIQGRIDVPTTTTTTEPPPPPPDTNTDEIPIFDLQTKKIGFYFWDESEVYNMIITRYNQYYTPGKVANESELTDTKCKDGEVITGFTIKDPKSCYYQGRRVIQIEFQCGVVDGANGDILDIYTSIRTKEHTLQDHNLANTKTSVCKKGYTGIKLEYYKNPKRLYLVDAWGFKMICADGTEQGHVIKAYPEQDLNKWVKEVGSASCATAKPLGKLINGFQHKVSHNDLGTFEGVYFKAVLCV